MTGDIQLKVHKDFVKKCRKIMQNVIRKKGTVIDMNQKKAYILLSFVPAFVSLGAQILISMLWQDALNRHWVQMKTGSILVYHMAGVLLFGIWHGFDQSHTATGNQQLKRNAIAIFKMLVFSVLGGIVMCFFGNSILGMEQYLFPKLYQDYVEMMDSAGMGTDLFTILASVVLAPVGEEFLCRGITLNYAKKGFSHFAFANCLQAFIFALIHLNFIQGVYAFAIGLFLGYLRESYDSLLPCIILHFTVNVFSTFFFGRILSGFPNCLPAYLLLFVASLAGTMVLVYGSKKVLKS